MTRALTFLVVFASSACTKNEARPPVNAVAELKRVLAEREKRLTSYRIEVTTTEGANVARHRFAFRSPNKSRGHVLAPQEVELAFDGAQLVRVLHGPGLDGGAPRTVNEVVPLDLPPADRAYFLASTFMPFAPEGFRTPLLPMTGVEVTAHEDQLDVVIRPSPQVEVRYRLRASNGDFFEKQTRAEGRVRTLKVMSERCEDSLKLCVPTHLQETLTLDDGGAQPLGTTDVTALELNPPLPQDFFTP